MTQWNLDNSEDEKEEERLKLKERALQLQKVVDEQSKLLREKENQEIQTKKKAAKHLKEALLSGDKINRLSPPTTCTNKYQRQKRPMSKCHILRYNSKINKRKVWSG